MEDIQFYQILLASWENCSECNVSRDLTKPQLLLTGEKMKAKLQKKRGNPAI